MQCWDLNCLVSFYLADGPSLYKINSIINILLFPKATNILVSSGEWYFQLQLRTYRQKQDHQQISLFINHVIKSEINEYEHFLSPV